MIMLHLHRWQDNFLSLALHHGGEQHGISAKVKIIFSNAVCKILTPIHPCSRGIFEDALAVRMNCFLNCSFFFVFFSFIFDVWFADLCCWDMTRPSHDAVNESQGIQSIQTQPHMPKNEFQVKNNYPKKTVYSVCNPYNRNFARTSPFVVWNPYRKNSYIGPDIKSLSKTIHTNKNTVRNPYAKDAKIGRHVNIFH